MMRLFPARPLFVARSRGLCSAWLVLALFARPSHADAPEITPFAGARVTLTLDKPGALVGENVVVCYRLENIGAKPFWLAGSKHRYRFTAWYPDGKPAPVPYTGLFESSDFYTYGPLQPGASKTWYIPLPTYCLMDRAGTYRVRLEQVLGGETWNTRGRVPPEAALTPIAVGETTLTLDAPSAEQAHQIVDAMSKLPLKGELVGRDGQTTPFADYSILHHAAYLPFLKERVRAGHREALTGVDSIATSEATAVLIDACLRGDLGWWDQRLLLRRVPPYEAPGTFDYNHLPDEMRRMSQPTLAGWRPEFGPVLRDWARRTLANRAAIPLADRYQQVQFAASLLAKLGPKADKLLIDAALCDTPAPPVQPRDELKELLGPQPGSANNL